MFGLVCDYSSSKLKTKQYKQATSTKGYKTKIFNNPARLA